MQAQLANEMFSEEIFVQRNFDFVFVFVSVFDELEKANWHVHNFALVSFDIDQFFSVEISSLQKYSVDLRHDTFGFAKLARDFQLVDEVPVEPHDRPLDCIVTSDTVIADEEKKSLFS